MTKESFDDAVRQAKEFIERAKRVEWKCVPASAACDGYTHLVSFVESAALKRQSMELTRALAKMRKP